MMRSPQLNLWIAVAFCGAVGLYDTLYVVFLLTGGPKIGLGQWVLFPDFLGPHLAVRAYFEGKLALVYDMDAFTRLLNTVYAKRFPFPVDLRPFVYPPVWLLMLLPFGLLAVDWACFIFLTSTAAAAIAVLASRRDSWTWLAVMTSPAAVWVVVSGQNTFLSVALLYGGLRILDRSPAIAGILLGLLVYKPQIWVLVPLALLAARQWRALAWAAGTVAALSLASLGVFGLDCWLGFLEMTREPSSTRIFEHMFRVFFPFTTTPYFAVRILGLPAGLATAVQFAGAALGVAAVWFAFRRYPSSDARTAVLVAAMFLVSPYILNYDLLLLMPAAIALYRRGAAEGFYPMEQLVYPALWVIPTVGMTLNRHALPIIPLIVVLFGVIAWTRLRTENRAVGEALLQP